MVLGAFANCKVRDLHQVKGKLNQTGYHSILQHPPIPSGIQLVGQGFVLKHDNDPKHTSKLCKRYIKSKEEQHVLQLMSSLVQSVYLNPIELKSHWSQSYTTHSVANIWQLAQKSWAELFLVYLQSLVERILRFCEAMIEAKEVHFDESKV